MSKLVFSVVAGFWLAATTAAPGATYYLAADGNNANPGTKARPWKSLQFASGKVVPGDVVKLKPGVYRQMTVVIGCEGTAKQPIVFEADGGQVTLDFAVTPDELTPAGASPRRRALHEVGAMSCITETLSAALLGEMLKPDRIAVSQVLPSS